MEILFLKKGHFLGPPKLGAKSPPMMHWNL